MAFSMITIWGNIGMENRPRRFGRNASLCKPAFSSTKAKGVGEEVRGRLSGHGFSTERREERRRMRSEFPRWGNERADESHTRALAGFAAGEEEIPVDEDDEAEAADGHNYLGQHLYPPHGRNLNRRRRRELETTETELKAMAAEAMIGLRRSPKNG